MVVFDSSDQSRISCLLSLTSDSHRPVVVLRASTLRIHISLLFHWHLRLGMVAGLALLLLLLLFGVTFRQKILNNVLEEETTRHLETARVLVTHNFTQVSQVKVEITLPKFSTQHACFFPVMVARNPSSLRWKNQTSMTKLEETTVTNSLNSTLSSETGKIKTKPFGAQRRDDAFGS